MTVGPGEQEPVGSGLDEGTQQLGLELIGVARDLMEARRRLIDAEATYSQATQTDLLVGSEEDVMTNIQRFGQLQRCSQMIGDVVTDLQAVVTELVPLPPEESN